MKLFALAAAAATALAATPVLADGHIQGRVKALGNATKALEKNGIVQATRIIGDKGKGNGNEPFRALETDFADHDPNVAGGNGGDPDVTE